LETPTATSDNLFLPIAAYRERNGTLNFEQHGSGPMPTCRLKALRFHGAMKRSRPERSK
jgi:hypothetical protein